MFTKFLNCFVFTGLIGLNALSTANIAQAQPNRYFPNVNPGIHRTLMIPSQEQGRPNKVPNKVSSVIPQRPSGFYNPYYPGYNNPYYTKPIHPSQEIIIIDRDRHDAMPYYFRENPYYRDNEPYYSREMPYYPDHTPYYSRKVPYYGGNHRNNGGYASPYGDPEYPSYPYYNSH